MYIQKCDHCTEPAVQKVQRVENESYLVYYCRDHRYTADLDPAYTYINTDISESQGVEPISLMPFSAVNMIRNAEGDIEKFIRDMFGKIDASSFDPIDSSEQKKVVEYLSNVLRDIDLVDEWEAYQRTAG